MYLLSEQTNAFYQLLKQEVFHHNRRSALVQVDVYHENTLAAKAIVTSQIIERS
ncbi:MULTISPECIES: hypothetical protein [unclassified Facklamia]|uniref:hypothetical protein n=1 Tax=Aerococcaceae TaxID=186827 RepID=UPI0013B8490F|nr:MULTISPECIES: hypothetical protein [unclassified Facklamia]NEW64778.1 hypothetical protein [Facklamia sp. 252]NEW64779.1 hypothetical protein [Facklamia sp. 252]NEW68101.1 hypothetical protein [Facklamia sp. 253]QQD64934.1 hypothetical protein JDW14_06270 [Aerococcaceae bacterium zg-252]